MAIADIHYRIGQAAQAAVVALELPGDDVFGNIGERVYLQMLPDVVGLLMPCVILSFEGEKEKPLPGDSLVARWNYPTRIWVADTESPRKHEKARLYMSWRKAIIDTFEKQRVWRLPFAPEVEGSRIVPDIIFDQRLPQYQHMVSGVVMWASTTEVRPNVLPTRYGMANRDTVREAANVADVGYGSMLARNSVAESAAASDFAGGSGGSSASSS